MNSSVITRQTSYQLHAIPSGKRGTKETLKIMSRCVTTYKSAPAIRRLALSIVKKVPGKDWVGEVQALHSWVKRRIRYVRDVAGVETIQSPIETLKLMQGDCDDQATLLATMLAAIGHPSRFVAVGFTPGHFQHVFAETKIGPKWVSLETTFDWPIGYFPKKVRSRMERHNK